LKALEKRQIERMDNTEVTFLGFGALSIGRDWGYGTIEQRQRPSEEEAGQILNNILDLGVNLVDTARAYHQSEERIGKHISSRRNEYILATKCGEHSSEPSTYYDFSYDAIKESIDRSLRLLKTDVIDLLQIHFGPNPAKVIEDGETLAAMKEAKKEGKIRFLGASIDGDLATQLIRSRNFDVMQMEYHLLNQKNKQNIQFAKERGIGVFIRTGIGRGLLTSRALELMNTDFPEKQKVGQLLELVGNDGDLLHALALEFLYQEEGISSVLLGTKSIERFKKNMQLLEQEIDPQILRRAIEIGAN